MTTDKPEKPAKPENERAATAPQQPTEAAEPAPAAEPAEALPVEVPPAAEPTFAGEPASAVEPAPAAEPAEPVPAAESAATTDAVESAEAGAADAEGGDDVPAPEADTPRRTRRVRTGRLLAVAVAIGVVGGVGTGYGIQASRAQTPPPRLAAAEPHYPAARTGKALTAAEDDMVKTDGDLTKLMMSAPKGAKSAFGDPLGPHWLSLPDYAEMFDNPASAFTNDLTNGFRRAAESDWIAKNGDYYEVQVVQYQHDHELETRTLASDWIISAGTDNDSVAVYGAEHGQPGAVIIGHKLRSNGDSSTYESAAFAQHGDLVVAIYVDTARIPSEPSIAQLLEAQVERL